MVTSLVALRKLRHKKTCQMLVQQRTTWLLCMYECTLHVAYMRYSLLCTNDVQCTHRIS